MDFGLFFFAAETDRDADPYALLREAARRVDGKLRFVSVPERHYHRFGGLYPAPALALAALSSITHTLELRFGSLIAPLHDAVEMAEWYAMLTGLAHGRIGIAFGSGWHRRDFALRPERYEARRELLFEQIAAFQAMIAGDASPGRAAAEPIELHPRPPRSRPRIWITSSGSTSTFREAGLRGFNVLTHLETSAYAELADKVAAYRAARRSAGHDPGAGIVTLMMHTFVHDDAPLVDRAIAGLRRYVDAAIDLERSSARLSGRMSGGRAAHEHELAPGPARDEVIELAVERYLAGASLIGAPRACASVVAEAAACGVDELACLIDYPSDPELVLSGLDGLVALAATCSAEARDRERRRLIGEFLGAEDASA